MGKCRNCSEFQILFSVILVLVSVISGSESHHNESHSQGAAHPIYDFARNIFLKTAEIDGNQDRNVLISPFSVRAISALLYLGANGKTAQEIGEALQFSNDPERLIAGLGKHMQQTQTQPGQNFIFKVGNGIFVQKGVPLNRTYTDIAEQKLRSTVRAVNFRAPEKARQEINGWVASVTENKIPDLLPYNSIHPQTNVFLGNALYFSGRWDKPFDPTVPERESKFYLSPKQSIQVPMMQIESLFGYAYISRLQATGISIPFKDHRFEFIVLKPDGSLQELEARLKNYPLNHLATDIKAYTRNVVLKMPKFKLDVNYNLKDVMKQLGVKTLFDPENADLSGLTKTGERHMISQIIHRTSLDINEDGATAASATGVEFYPISSPSIFAIDKPFMFMINDRLTGPVLIGHLVNPLDILDYQD